MKVWRFAEEHNAMTLDLYPDISVRNPEHE